MCEQRRGLWRGSRGRRFQFWPRPLPAPWSRTSGKLRDPGLSSGKQGRLVGARSGGRGNSGTVWLSLLSLAGPRRPRGLVPRLRRVRSAQPWSTEGAGPLLPSTGFETSVGGYRLMSFRLLQGGFSYLFTTGIPGGQTLVIRWLRHPQCAGQTYMLSRGTAAGQKLRAGGVCGRQLPGWRRHTPAWRGHVRSLQYQHFGPVLCELSVALCPMVEE